MLTPKEKEIVNQYVDEYIDGLRMDVIVLERTRFISEESSSTIEVIDFETREQVMEYQGKIPPDVLAEIVYNYGEKYKAYVVVDITGGMGVTTVLKLVEMEYKNLLNN